MKKTLLSTKTFSITEHSANSVETIRYDLIDDTIFIHAYESKSGKNIQSFASVYANSSNSRIAQIEQTANILPNKPRKTNNAVDIYMQIGSRQIDVTASINKNHSNSLSLKKILQDNNITLNEPLQYVDFIVQCKDLYSFKGTSIIVGVK